MGGPAINRFVVISGCSGGGKSTLLDELGRRGYAIVEEPGRRIVREEMLGEGTALPGVDPLAFARRAVALALADRKEARRLRGWVFFDRGLIDASVAVQHLSGEPALARVRRSHRYHQRVFLAPPWPEIYVTDNERQHGFDAAIAEYERLVVAYPALGYETTVLPKVGVAERAEIVLRTLAHAQPTDSSTPPRIQPAR
jgi:predicted ATPase